MILRQEIANLQFELMEYKQGKRIMGADGQETTNDMYHENTMMSKENSNLRTRIKAMQETIEVLTSKNAQLLADKEVLVDFYGLDYSIYTVPLGDWLEKKKKFQL